MLTSVNNPHLTQIQLQSFLSPFLVNEDTQMLLDLNTLVADFLATLRIGVSTNERTPVHDQRNTYLCHSFSTMSAFHQVLIQFLSQFQNQVGLENLSLRHKTIIRKVIESIDEYSFQRMLVAFCGNVNPQGIRRNQNTQTAMLETVMERLVDPTVFEIDGWKRIGPVREMFDGLHLNIDDYELNYERVTHPHSAIVERVTTDYYGSSPFQPASNTFQVQQQ